MSLSAECDNITLHYVINDDVTSDLESRLNMTFKDVVKFSSEEEMVAILRSDNTSLNGFVFEKLAKDTFKYKLLKFPYRYPALFVEKLSDESGAYISSEVRTDFAEEVAVRIHLCLTATLFDETHRNRTVNRGHLLMKKGHVYGRPVIGQYRWLHFYLLPILLHTAMIIASDKENGMKEFLLVMGLGRFTLFFEGLFFAYIKAAICTFVAIIPTLGSIDKDIKPILVGLSFLMALAMVLLGMLCALLADTAKGAVTIAGVLYFVMIVLLLMSPTVFEANTGSYLFYLNVINTFSKTLDSVSYAALRGHKIKADNLTSEDLFFYSDMFNPGLCFIAFLIDVALILTLTIFLEFFTLKSCFLCVYRMFSGKKLASFHHLSSVII
ncbi:hypothetical protein Q1695_015534 [Nippostrongylus brasiliensis]|nr:hypothetical protein Q1695_015534 [Nippostrongylus brasiliensis]